MTNTPHSAMNFRRTLPGLYRSGNLTYLSAQGREELLTLGITRMIDLRTRPERLNDAPPFLGQPEYLNLSILPYRNRELNGVYAQAISNAANNIALLDQGGNQIVAILGAILDAPSGPVLIHCHGGKDRTGLIAALCGELAGLSREQIAADYARSNDELVGFYAEIRAGKTPQEWAKLERFAPSLPEDILPALAHLDEQWGGVAAYLDAYGLSREEQAALARRLLSA